VAAALALLVPRAFRGSHGSQTAAVKTLREREAAIYDWMTTTHLIPASFSMRIGIITDTATIIFPLTRAGTEFDAAKANTVCWSVLNHGFSGIDMFGSQMICNSATSDVTWRFALEPRDRSQANRYS
jgi:hypothetical protein